MIPYPTPNRATLSIAGLYSWDEHIFDLLQVPSGVDKNLIIQNILLECSELTVIYPDWGFMQKAIGSWSSKEIEIWNKIYNLEHLDYNPIENYDRYEDETENIGSNGKTFNFDSKQAQTSGTDSSENTVKVAGFNTDSVATQNQQKNASSNMSKDGNAASSLAIGDNQQTRSKGSRIHGNIGVVTSQQMIEQSLTLLPKVHIDDYIINSFKERFCILVY